MTHADRSTMASVIDRQAPAFREDGRVLGSHIELARAAAGDGAEPVVQAPVTHAAPFLQDVAHPHAVDVGAVLTELGEDDSQVARGMLAVDVDDVREAAAVVGFLDHVQESPAQGGDPDPLLTEVSPSSRFLGPDSLDDVPVYLRDRGVAKRRERVLRVIRSRVAQVACHLFPGELLPSTGLGCDEVHDARESIAQTMDGHGREVRRVSEGIDGAKDLDGVRGLAGGGEVVALRQPPLLEDDAATLEFRPRLVPHARIQTLPRQAEGASLIVPLVDEVRELHAQVIGRNHRAATFGENAKLEGIAPAEHLLGHGRDPPGADGIDRVSDSSG